MRRALLSLIVPMIALACNSGSGAATADKTAPKPPASAAASPALTSSAGPLLLGERITEKPIALSEITHNAKAYENKVVATSGTVFAMCQSMGCWMEIKDDASEAHVKLGGH